MNGIGRRGTVAVLITVLLATLAGPAMAGDATFAEKARYAETRRLDYGQDGRIPPLIDAVLLRPAGLLAIGLVVPFWAVGLPFATVSPYGAEEYTLATLGRPVRFVFGTPLGGY